MGAKKPAEKYREFEVTIRYRLQEDRCLEAAMGTLKSEKELWRDRADDNECLRASVKVRRLK